ncbi:hypothetical protein KQX54_003186 [Cotesia glomerata]|uniref:Uncharacterized protein n=1 Tax=Cotesia glomerata TaxID=32391 RepID=A0AAV7IM14_COTGL|nr:hypothetical protein KQX54_003186 [Cotesia glomerata]
MDSHSGRVKDGPWFGVLGWQLNTQQIKYTEGAKVRSERKRKRVKGGSENVCLDNGFFSPVLCSSPGAITRQTLYRVVPSWEKNTEAAR